MHAESPASSLRRDPKPDTRNLLVTLAGTSRTSVSLCSINSCSASSDSGLAPAVYNHVTALEI